MNPEFLARFEGRFRPFLASMPTHFAVALYSRGRKRFVDSFATRPPSTRFSPEGLDRTLWGIRFRLPICNAAGMFKSGDGYKVVARQGAGAWLAGTTTHRPRRGNRRNGTPLPFAPYPRSGAASNWLGLPNPGHAATARKIARLERVDGCPVGASLSADPQPPEKRAQHPEEQRLDELVAGMRLYADAGVDFLEMNESCPNTEEGPSGLGALRGRLEHVREGFLSRRERSLPVIVKLSCDTALEQVDELVDLLLELDFDGVNFGNTSTAYALHRESLHESERALFDDFSRTFGGGLSGRPLKNVSLRLASAAVARVRAVSPEREFHVLRTGGIEEAADLHASDDAGVSLNQWYSGYFEAFAHHGHDLYQVLARELT